MIEMSKVTVPVGYSALGRPIDPSYPSNVLAVGVAAATALLFGGYNVIAAEPLASSWFEASVGVFLSWAIGRELDPDNNLTAALAMPVALLSALAVAPSLLFGFGVLTATRLCTGSSGVDLKPLDLVAVPAIGALLGTGPIPLATVPALAVGVLILDGASRRGMVQAGLATAAGVVTAIINGPWAVERELGLVPVLLVAVVATATALTVPAPPPVSKGDTGKEPLVGWRITAARATAAATVLGAGLVAGGHGVESAFGTGGAAILGVMTVKFLPQKGNESEIPSE